MIFYHGTSKENWDAIQKEGVLYGRRFITDNAGNIIKEVSRCTYLAVDIEDAKHFGEVVLQVEYNPFMNPKENNYIEDCYQIRVYEPIPLENVFKIKVNEGLNELNKAAEQYAATGEILPNGKEMIDFQKELSFKAGAEWQKKQLIDKACEWLESNVEKYIYNATPYPDADFKACVGGKCWEYFRKAMEI